MPRLISFLGLLTMIFIAWLMSENRKKLNLRTVFAGVLLQFVFALFILKTDIGLAIFGLAQGFIQTLISLSDQGAEFIFGSAFEETIFAFKVLPTIIFISSLSAVLFHLGILQRLIQSIAWVMYKTMGLSGVESLAAAANIFCGQTEAPLLIRPYLKSMTRSEIFTMMTSGMATVAGGVLAAYVAMGISAGHLLAASVMSAPASIVIAKIMFPETATPETKGSSKVELDLDDSNIFDAACRGASEGMKLSLNVAAMLIAFIALVAFVNVCLGSLSSLWGGELTLQQIFSYIFYPFAYVMGVPAEDCFKIAGLLGEKTALNEFYAYVHLGELVKEGALQQRSITIVTYALCGFASFSSIAIQIGGVGAIEPSRKKTFAALAFKSMIGGTLAAFMTACIAGVLS